MAEREGFEPPMGLHPCRISSAVHSTTLPPLQVPEGVAFWLLIAEPENRLRYRFATQHPAVDAVLERSAGRRQGGRRVVPHAGQHAVEEGARDADRGVPQALARHLRMETGGQHRRGVSVPKIVEPHPRQPDLGDQDLPLMGRGARLNGFAILARVDEGMTLSDAEVPKRLSLARPVHRTRVGEEAGTPDRAGGPGLRGLESDLLDRLLCGPDHRNLLAVQVAAAPPHRDGLASAQAAQDPEQDRQMEVRARVASSSVARCSTWDGCAGSTTPNGIALYQWHGGRWTSRLSALASPALTFPAGAYLHTQ